MSGSCVLEESHISGAGALAQQAEELDTPAWQSESIPRTQGELGGQIPESCLLAITLWHAQTQT